MTWRRAVPVLAVLAAVAVASCGGTDEGGVRIPAVYDLSHDPSVGIAEVDPTRTDVLPARDLRLALEDLFVTHGITLVHSMRAVAGEGDPSPWIDELVANTDDVVGAVGLVYGPVGADAFHQQWAQHTQFLVDYADAARRGDERAADEARARLASYADDSGSLLSTALGGALDADAAEQLLAAHVSNMIRQVDAFVAGDTAESVRISVEDNAHLVEVAAALVAGFSAQQPGAFPGGVDDDDALICSIARRSAGDLAFVALSPDAEEDLAGVGDAARSELDAALADLGAVAPSDELLDDVADAARNGDAAGATSAVLAWLEASRAAAT